MLFLNPLQQNPNFPTQRPQQGFNHQIEQVSCGLLAGKLQPEVVSWDDSRAFQR
ncbi:MAG: hypothetical protein NZ730_02845 [Porticoccaceae bacterium]|nr:hypothetical protein [Porticoccaceae bacterium]